MYDNNINYTGLEFMDSLLEIPKKITTFFKCLNCGVEFFIYAKKEMNEKLCGECKKLKDADNYKRSTE